MNDINVCIWAELHCGFVTEVGESLLLPTACQAILSWGRDAGRTRCRTDEMQDGLTSWTTVQIDARFTRGPPPPLPREGGSPGRGGTVEP